MKLLLMRHGITVEREDWNEADEPRPLTSEGIQKTRQAAHGLNRIENHVDLIASSPLRRAIQTRDIVREVFNDADSAMWAELENAEPESLLRHLRALKIESVLLVGHEPSLGRFASQLLCGTPDAMAIDFKKAAVCALQVSFEGDTPHATLLWHAAPKLLRSIASD